MSTSTSLGVCSPSNSDNHGREVRLPATWWGTAVYGADDSVLLDVQEMDERFAV